MNMENIDVRELTMRDYGEVADSWRQSEGIGLGESDEPTEIERYLVRNPGMNAVAVSDGRIVGAVLCGDDGRRGYLHHLAVAPTHRRRGIARALLRFCLEQLRLRGISKCNIFLFTHNVEGQTFWLHNGWIDRTDLKVMQKVLPKQAT
jgi:N-acetylglutamate synthase